MDEKLLEIHEFSGEGYQPLIDFESWRVAMLRYLDEMHPGHIDKMERHMQTDEVWVLLQGRVVILLGGNGTELEGVFSQVMEAGKIYNVKRCTWHTALLSRDASVLLVENEDTGPGNTEYLPLLEEMRARLKDMACNQFPDI